MTTRLDLLIKGWIQIEEEKEYNFHDKICKSDKNLKFDSFIKQQFYIKTW